MGRTTYRFHGIKGRAEHRFTCPQCGKASRLRTFVVENTVNPFNKNADGTVKTAAEVFRDAASAAVAKRDEFSTEPLCASCEDALPVSDLRALQERRRASAGRPA